MYILYIVFYCKYNLYNNICSNQLYTYIAYYINVLKPTRNTIS